MAWRVPLFDLDYDEREERAVLEVLRSKWLTMGEKTESFETKFAEYVGAKHAIAVANGTAALHLAVTALGIGAGDEVLVPDLTFVATANAVLYQDATPVLCDIRGENDLTVDPEDMRSKLTDRTAAIMIMHYGGYPCDMGPILELAREQGVPVIEDAAHAPGTEYEGVRAGRLGKMGCFSFFSNKNLSTGEGGLVTTDDPDIAASLRLLRSHGMTAQTLDRHKGHAWGYDVVDIGYNYRLTEIEAALGLVQLERLPEANEARRRLIRLYRERLASIPDIVVPFAGFGTDDWPFRGVTAGHLMEVVLPEGVDRRGVATAMAESGIQTSVHYRPLHTFTSPRLAAAPSVRLDRVSALAERIITLPLWPTMTESMVGEVCGSLDSALAQLRSS